MNTPIAAPFAAPFPIRSVEDVRRLEETPLEQALTVRSTYEIVRNSAAAFGDKVALTFLRSAEAQDAPIRWTYRELLAGVHQTANLLHALGLGPRDVVAVLLPACLEYHLAHWGGAAAGIVQPLNPLLSDDKLAALLAATGATALLAYGVEGDSGYWSKALRLRERVPTLRWLLRVAPHDEPEAPALPDGVVDFSRERVRQRDDRLVSGRSIAGADIATCYHTGGTTGAPKLALHSHANQVYTAWACVQLQGTRPSDVVLNGYPLFHVAGALPASLAPLAAGAEVVIPTPELLRNRAVIRNYWRLVERHRVTTLPAVPTVLAALAEVPLAGADISSLQYVRTGAAPLPPELAARFERQFGLHVHESLGMTETAGISAIRPPGVRGPAGCVGFVLPHSRLRIRSTDGRGDAPPGTPGVVLLKAPNVFAGYLDAADTARVITDGWLDTGDLGWLDAEGRLNLAGRAKDLIIRSGHNIDPKVIEDALGAHPAVQHCAAVGAPDAYAGELPVAYVQLRPGATATPEELLAFVVQHVDEAPARPKSVTLVEQLPLTNVGKVYKPALRALAHAAVVQALIGQTQARARTVIDNDSVAVLLDGDNAALREALARLPVTTPIRPNDNPPREETP